MALEEHYCDPDLTALFSEVERRRAANIAERLYDMGELRLRETDEGLIDVQVLSHAAPATQKLDAETAAFACDGLAPHAVGRGYFQSIASCIAQAAIGERQNPSIGWPRVAVQ